MGAGASLGSVTRIGEGGRGVTRANFGGILVSGTAVAVASVGDARLVQAITCEKDECEPCVAGSYAKSYTTEEVGKNKLMLRPWFREE
jgi:hypothetical protein